MDPLQYQALITQENKHWWWLARRAVVYTLLKGVSLVKSPIILDAGCGSGGNLAMLASIGDVFAMETYEPVLEVAKKRKIGRVEKGELPHNIPFPEINFDLVTITDVLEHIQDDLSALKALTERMNPGAVMCITVPAYQWLYSRSDKEAHHYRRYGKRQLIALIQEAGLNVHLISHWNCLLLPVAIAVRIIEKFTTLPSKAAIGTQAPAPWLNSMLYEIASLERYIIPHVALPFGLSLVALARKP